MSAGADVQLTRQTRLWFCAGVACREDAMPRYPTGGLMLNKGIMAELVARPGRSGSLHDGCIALRLAGVVLSYGGAGCPGAMPWPSDRLESQWYIAKYH